MKFLTFVDTHQDLKFLKDIVKRAKEEDIDFVICAGDLSIFGRGLRESLQLLDTIGKKVYHIPGNHEDNLKGWDALLAETKNNLDFHQKAVRIGDYVLLGYGGNGFSMQDAEFRKIARKWYGDHKEEKIIFVTHGPPYGTKLDVIDAKHLGNKDFTKFILRIQPKVAICGHFHETVGLSDKIGSTPVVHPGWEGMVIELK